MDQSTDPILERLGILDLMLDYADRFLGVDWTDRGKDSAQGSRTRDL